MAVEEILQSVTGEDYVSSGALADGGHLLVWMAPDGNSSRNGIWGQRFDAAGAEVGSTYLIRSSREDTLLIRPNLTQLEDGSLVLVWDNLQLDTVTRYDAFLQRLDATGQVIGGEARVNAYTRDNQYISDTASLADGGFVVTWRSHRQDGDNAGVFGRVYNADGQPMGGEFQANSNTSGAQLHQSVTGLVDGGFVVLWQAYAYGSGASTNYNISGQRFDASGQRVGGEFRVNSTTSGIQEEPQVIALQDGGFLALWASWDNSNLGLNIQRYDVDGAAVGEETWLETIQGFDPAIDDRMMDAIALQDGGFAVLWRDVETETLRLQSFDAEGTALTEEHQINADPSYGSNAGPSPNLEQLADGSLLVTWSEGLGVYREIVDAPPAPPSEPVTLTEGADLFTGTGEGEMISGLGGNDTIDGGGGNDTIEGGAGSDVLQGGAGDDLIVHNSNDGALNDTVDGGAGIDTLQFTGTGRNTINADAALTGIEKIQLGDASGNELLRVQAGGTYDFSGIEFLYSNGSIIIEGIDATSVIGGAQDDSLLSNYGADTLNGGAGNDYVWADGGNDVVYGGSGDDDLWGGFGEDVLDGGAGQDSLYGEVGNDTLDGGDGGDMLYGGDGTDVITGGSGWDVLWGDAGDDVLSGGTGSDSLTGGSGNDTLTGGADFDTFAFVMGGGADVVTDFETGNDWLEMHGVAQEDIVISSVTGGTLVENGLGDTVLLQNVDAADLSWDDFVFA